MYFKSSSVHANKCSSMLRSAGSSLYSFKQFSKKEKEIAEEGKLTQWETVN